MAISKKITDNDGITTTYHRITHIGLSVNGLILIEVASYVSQEYRQNQILFNQQQEKGEEPTVVLPYVVTRYYNEMPYTENISVEGVYEYLKTLPDFEGAEDIFEEGQPLSLYANK